MKHILVCSVILAIFGCGRSSQNEKMKENDQTATICEDQNYSVSFYQNLGLYDPSAFWPNARLTSGSNVVELTCETKNHDQDVEVACSEPKGTQVSYWMPEDKDKYAVLTQPDGSKHELRSCRSP
jgi:hypothetical protein